MATVQCEYSLQRIAADWIFYAGMYWADAEVISAEQIGARRRARLSRFDPALADCR